MLDLYGHVTQLVYNTCFNVLKDLFQSPLLITEQFQTVFPQYFFDWFVSSIPDFQPVDPEKLQFGLVRLRTSLSVIYVPTWHLNSVTPNTNIDCFPCMICVIASATLRCLLLSMIRQGGYGGSLVRIREDCNNITLQCSASSIDLNTSAETASERSH